MTSFCPKHQATLESNSPQAFTLWQSVMQKGHDAHQSGSYDNAFHYFAQAAEISAFLLKHHSQANRKNYAMALSLTEMRVNACHNLAATAVGRGDCNTAEKILTALHEEITLLCKDSQCQRWLRLEALTSLKNTLFSLASYLAEQGRLDTLRAIVNRTEEEARNVARQLLR